MGTWEKGKKERKEGRKGRREGREGRREGREGVSRGEKICSKGRLDERGNARGRNVNKQTKQQQQQ